MGPVYRGAVMTFHKTLNEEALLFEPVTAADFCFECGERIIGPGVTYDGRIKPETIKSLSFHPACAALVGQRLICDGFPHRL
ncbi:hypothetical protein D3C84_369310 [compost metagenome]